MKTTLLIDPTSERRPAQRSRVDRPSNLDGETVGLLDISKPRGGVFLDRIQKHLIARGSKVVRYDKPTYAKRVPADLRRQIVRECRVVIEALAD